MRPRHQEGQIAKRGSNWVLRYHEDRAVSGQTKRVRTTTVLASYEQYPYRTEPVKNPRPDELIKPLPADERRLLENWPKRFKPS